jgi:hypothetical protein
LSGNTGGAEIAVSGESAIRVGGVLRLVVGVVTGGGRVVVVVVSGGGGVVVVVVSGVGAVVVVVSRSGSARNAVSFAENELVTLANA